MPRGIRLEETLPSRARASGADSVASGLAEDGLGKDIPAGALPATWPPPPGGQQRPLPPQATQEPPPVLPAGWAAASLRGPPNPSSLSCCHLDLASALNRRGRCGSSGSRGGVSAGAWGAAHSVACAGLTVGGAWSPGAHREAGHSWWVGPSVTGHGDRSRFQQEQGTHVLA